MSRCLPECHQLNAYTFPCGITRWSQCILHLLLQENMTTLDSLFTLYILIFGLHGTSGAIVWIRSLRLVLPLGRDFLIPFLSRALLLSCGRIILIFSGLTLVAWVPWPTGSDDYMSFLLTHSLYFLIAILRHCDNVTLWHRGTITLSCGDFYVPGVGIENYAGPEEEGSTTKPTYAAHKF